MRQPIVRAAEVARRPPEKAPPRQLLTLAGITREMVRLYVQARNGDLEVQKCGTLVRVLERIRYAVAAGPLEERLDAIEATIAERDGQRLGRPNGHGGDYPDDDDDDRRGVLQ